MAVASVLGASVYGVGKVSQVKEIEVTVSLRNNRLKERRDALGMNQQQLCSAAGVLPSEYGRLEKMLSSPFTKEGAWRQPVLRLADFHKVGVEDLFPDAVLEIKERQSVLKVDAADVGLLLSSDQEARLLGPGEVFDAKELPDAASVLIDECLTPREARVIRLRFGLGGAVIYSTRNRLT